MIGIHFWFQILVKLRFSSSNIHWSLNLFFVSYRFQRGKTFCAFFVLMLYCGLMRANSFSNLLKMTLKWSDLQWCIGPFCRYFFFLTRSGVPKHTAYVLYLFVIEKNFGRGETSDAVCKNTISYTGTYRELSEVNVFLWTMWWFYFVSWFMSSAFILSYKLN